jgi:hypothetical protein
MASNPASFGPRNRANCDAEQFIVPTVFSAPTASSEQGMIPGIPVANTSNLSSGVRVEVLGGISQARSYPGPTIEIQIEQPGTIRAPVSLAGDGIAQQILDSAETIDQAVAAVGKGLRNRVNDSSLSLAIPRVGIRRSNNNGVYDFDFLGVRENFTLWPSASYYLNATPTGGSGTWTWADVVIPLVWNDSLFAVGLAVDSGIDAKIRVFQYDPTVSTYWSEYLTSDYVSLLTQATSVEVPTTICANVIGGQLYVVVGVERTSGYNRGTFYVFRVRDQQIVLVGSAVDTTRDKMDGGASLIGHPSGDGGILAFGSRRNVGGSARLEVNLAASADLRTWPKDSRSSALDLPTLSDFQTVVKRLTANAMQGRSYRSKVAFTSVDAGSSGFMVDTLGRIWSTDDGGSNWTRQTTPSDGNNLLSRKLPLRGVATAVSGTSKIAYAVGDGGLILKYASDTWKVLSCSASDPEKLFSATQFVSTAATAKALKLNLTFNAVAVDPNNADRFWIVGDAGTVLYSANGGTSITTVQSLAGSRGAYTDLVVDASSPTSGNLIAVGDPNVHDIDATTQAERRTRLALLVNATTTSPTVKRFAPAGQGSTGDDQAIVAITYAATTGLTEPACRCYALTADGRILKWSGGGVTLGGTVVEVANLGPGQFFDLSSPSEANKLFVVGQRSDGLSSVWQSIDANATPTQSPPAPTFTAQGLPDNARGVSVQHFDDSTASIACTDRLVFAKPQATQRTYPALYRLADGSLLLACANVSTGRLQIFKAGRPDAGAMPQFRIVYDGLSFDPPTTVPAVGTTEWDKIPRPSIAEDHLGHILVAAGITGVVSTDGGSSWLAASDLRLPLSLGDVTLSGSWTLGKTRASRAVCGFGGARLFSLAINGDGTKCGTFVARDLDSSATKFLPIQPGRPFWTGIDSVRANLVGLPEPGDRWTISTKALYPASNMMKDSPSIVWRGAIGSFWFATPGQTLTWTAPAGTLFDVSSFALFGCNFQSAILATSVFGFPSEQNQKYVVGSVATGFAAALTSTTFAAIRDTSATWNPHCFAPGSGRTYRVTINDIEGTKRVYRITDNTHNVLFLDTTDTPPVPADAECAYTVWSDVHVWDGTDAQNPDGTFDLNTSEYRVCQTVTIEIPTQPTAEGYFQIGTARLGVVVDSTTPATETDAARLYAPNWVHSIVPNTTEEMGLSGVATVEHFGQVQRWQLTLEAAPHWYRERLLAAMGRRQRLRDAFAIVLDPSYPQETKLVRLSGEITQESVGADEANVRLPLVEVV